MRWSCYYLDSFIVYENLVYSQDFRIIFQKVRRTSNFLLFKTCDNDTEIFHICNNKILPLKENVWLTNEKTF